MNQSTGLDPRDRRLESHYRVLVSIIAAGVATIGALAAIGWILGIESLVRLRPELNVMKFNTALCLVASGAGLLLLLHGRKIWRSVVPRVIGAGVLAIAAMSALEALVGWNFHIDQLFWNDLCWQVDKVRMAPQTALVFVFAGLFLVVFGVRRRPIAQLGSGLALLANLTAQEEVLDLIFRSDKVTGAAGHTAVAVLALSMGMLLFPSPQGMLAPVLSRSAGGKIIRWLVPAATLLPLLTGWIYLATTSRGLLTPASGIVVMVVLYSATLVLITVWNAKSIDKLDLRLSAIVDWSENAIVSKSLDGTIMTWNDGAQQLYGYSAAEAIGKPVWMLVPPEYHEVQLRSLEQVRRGESVRHSEVVRVRKDGSRVYVSVTLSPLRNAFGEVIGSSAIARDVTERRSSDEKIRELTHHLELRVEERTRQLHESELLVRRKLETILSPEGDVDSLELHDLLDVQTVQPLMEDLCTLTGIPVAIIDLGGKVLVGAGWQDICTKFHRIHPETCKNCLESDCHLTQGVAPGEFRLYRCKNNMWDVVTPIMLGDRHIGNLFSGQFLFDEETIDEQAFAAQARRYGFNEAEYLAALHRVPRISNARMQSSMQMCSRLAGVLSQLGYGSVKLARAMDEANRTNRELTHSSKELERFAYSVSHDLRAPLRHMDGFLSLLSKRVYEGLDERGKHYIDCTLEASQRMGRLIDDLLQFSRLGRSEMHKSQASLNQIIDDVRVELEPESRGREIQWEVDQFPIVSADPGMLRQVVENLLANALKFTRKRPVARISVGQMPEADEKIVIFVRDNGAGFDMRYYSKLFQVFQRLHGEEEFEGTGVGLANVRRIVERHGGEVWAESTVDQGATFYFSLPHGNSSTGEHHELVETHLAG